MVQRSLAALAFLILISIPSITFAESIKSAPVEDYGYGTRGWVTIDSDSRPDFCRIAGPRQFGEAVMLCQLTTRVDGGMNPMTVSSALFDSGYDGPRAWITVGQEAYFCRGVGNDAAKPAPCCSKIKLDNTAKIPKLSIDICGLIPREGG